MTTDIEHAALTGWPGVPRRPTNHVQSRRHTGTLAALAVSALLAGAAACSSADDGSVGGTAVTNAPASAAPRAPTPTTIVPSSTAVPRPPTTSAADPARQTLLRGILERHRAAGEFVGARLALRDPDGTVTEVSAGTTTVDPASGPVDVDAPWNVGSVTKMFVAVVALQLADEGRLDLDAGIDRYLPTLAGAERITPRQLLQHTSGLGEYANQPAVVAEPGRVWKPAELIVAAEAGGRVGEPGGPHHYSNTNYIVLGEIIEQVTGHPWADEVRTRIVEPLGLTHTGVITDERPIGYQVVDGSFVDTTRKSDPSIGGAAGAMASTGRDLLLFATALADGTLMSPSSQAAMQAFVPAEDYSQYGITHGYGLGMEQYATGTITVNGHMGTGEAQSAYVGYDTADGTAVAVMTNTATPGPQAIMAVEALAAAKGTGSPAP